MHTLKETSAADGISLSDFQILYQGEDYLQKCLATALWQGLCARGIDLPLCALPFEGEGGRALLTLQWDEGLARGAWELCVAEKRITIAANGYLGMDSAIQALLDAITPDCGIPFEAGALVRGHYTDRLGDSDAEQTLRYAHQSPADHRVMFHNVLFFSGKIGSRYYPAEERSILQAAMVGEYLPDVLGCQELNKTKRCGDYPLPALLEKLGYVETVDPRVRNAYDESEKIPHTDSFATTGEGAGTPLDGYGTKIAVEVNVNGQDCYTFYNNTPLFYNTATTKCIASEYYWYRHQKDARPGQEHTLSANDCGSKSLTWGVFESRRTGERYIVISTHMCSANNYIRGLQAREAVEVIETLKRTYGYPVFFGGDMNGNFDDENYLYFMSEEIGYSSLQDDAVASEHSSMVRSTHGYPNHDGSVIVPAGAPEIATRGESIDHIFIEKAEPRLAVKVFGVVADFCSLRGSDHFPILADFSLR